MKKVYIAGPDVFRQDAKSWAEDVRTLVASFGFEALLPSDNDKTNPFDIYIANCKMIEQCDIILANVNQFRGVEPDSGTCFEIGFAAALDKQIALYASDNRPICDKVRLSLYGCHRKQDIITDINGYLVEDFDLPLNLMLSMCGEFVHGNIHEALTYLKEHNV